MSSILARLRAMNWQHYGLLVLAAALALVSLHDKSSGVPLVAYGVPVAAALTTLLALFTNPPGGGGGTGAQNGSDTPPTQGNPPAPVLHRAALVLGFATIAACAAAQPIDTNQVVNYGEGLAACETKEAQMDASADAKMDFYVNCKHALGVDAGGL